MHTKYMVSNANDIFLPALMSYQAKAYTYIKSKIRFMLILIVSKQNVLQYLFPFTDLLKCLGGGGSGAKKVDVPVSFGLPNICKSQLRTAQLKVCSSKLNLDKYSC